jgi:hypothetical protein
MGATPRFCAVRKVPGEEEFWNRMEILAEVSFAATKSVRLSPLRSPKETLAVSLPTARSMAPPKAPGED